VRYRFIRDNERQFRISTMCRVLSVSRSGYYGWLRSVESKRELSNGALLSEIRAVHAKSRGTYGCRRVHQQLKARHQSCSKNRVARLMRVNGIKSRRARKFRATTDSRHSFPVAPNLLERQFAADAPNRIWASDITYVPTEEGWLYVASVMDLYSRMIVGWSMGERLSRDLAMDALKMAIRQRKPSAGLIHHSDRGSQYASNDYRSLLEKHDMLCSMSKKGDCWDNAVMESFFGSLKTECTLHRRYHSRNEATRDIFHYMEIFYNSERLHSALGYLSPAHFELLEAA
jgi:putative transposase